MSETLSADAFLRIGEGCADLIGQHLSAAGVELAGANRVLDFGCGCGRTIAWFLGDRGRAELHGVDVDAEAVDWCSRHLRGGHFLKCAPTPPLPYPAAHFDIIYCLSVFTHLDECMQDAWLAEFDRLVKPNGILLLSIYGEEASGILDADGRQLLQTYGLVHRRSSKLRGLLPDWYQTTFHSRDYIVKRLSQRFSDVRYSAVPGGEQNVVTARKNA